MRQIERSGAFVAGSCVRGAEFLGFGPRLERRLVLPDRMGGVEGVVFRLRSLEQVEFDEARHPIEVGIAFQPDLFEGFFRASLYLKAVHSDKHRVSPVAKATVSFRS